MKKAANIFLFSGLIIFCFFILIPLIQTWILPSAEKGAIGIIGGADSPTTMFITLKLLNRFEQILVAMSVPFILTGTVMHIFKKDIANVCTLKSSLMAYALSFLAGTAAYFYFRMGLIAIFDEYSLNPIRYPVSIVGLIICAILFIGLTVYYFYRAKKEKKLGRVKYDIPIFLLYLIPNFVIIDYIDYVIETII